MSDFSKPSAPSRVSQPTAVPQGRSVLVVERDPHVRELQLNFLTRGGFSVDYATDGHAGLALAEALVPDLVVTEILVPKLDGLALCSHLKAGSKTSHVPVLVCSMLAATARAREAGADAFMKKPLAEQRYMDTIRGVFAARQPTT